MAPRNDKCDRLSIQSPFVIVFTLYICSFSAMRVPPANSVLLLCCSRALRVHSRKLTCYLLRLYDAYALQKIFYVLRENITFILTFLEFQFLISSTLSSPLLTDTVWVKWTPPITYIINETLLSNIPTLNTCVHAGLKDNEF